MRLIARTLFASSSAFFATGFLGAHAGQAAAVAVPAALLSTALAYGLDLAAQRYFRTRIDLLSIMRMVCPCCSHGGSLHREVTSDENQVIVSCSTCLSRFELRDARAFRLALKTASE
jgi:hypothetical protein